MMGTSGRAAPHAPGDRMRELGAVDDDERAGLGRDGCGGGRMDAAQDRRQAREDAADPHHGHILHRKLRHEALLRHQRAANAEVADAAAAARVEHRHQLGAQRVAGMLARHQEEPQLLGLGRRRPVPHAAARRHGQSVLRAAIPLMIPRTAPGTGHGRPPAPRPPRRARARPRCRPRPRPHAPAPTPGRAIASRMPASVRASSARRTMTPALRQRTPHCRSFAVRSSMASGPSAASIARM